MATADETKPAVSEPTATPGAQSGVLLARLDFLLAGLVVLFAFVVALFPARNSDFLQQLATGRLVAQGQYSFGADPFTVAGDKTGWVNHSWLYGLVSYLLYQLPRIGPELVVVLKALLVACVAGLMLRLGRRPGQTLYIPAVVTALAVLAISPRVFLQPVVISYLFLALTLCLLEHPRRLRERGGAADAAPTAWWLIPPLFVLWVNCDQWFVLGPLTVALYWVGELLQKDSKGRAGLLGGVLATSVAACLINPYHVRAFTLPAQFAFSEGMDILKGDSHFRTQSVTPLQELYFKPYLGLSAAGLAYFPLAVLGLVSFVLVGNSFPWWRVMVWLGYLLLSLSHARAIPFFAVVAGPITALNFLDFAQARAATAGSRTSRFALGGRLLALLAGVFVLVAGAVGLLQANPQDERRVGVGVVIDPLLKRAAEKFAQHASPDGAFPFVCFNNSPEVVPYLSWFSPGVRAFADGRLPQFPEAARAYRQIKESLASVPAVDSAPGGLGGPGLVDTGYRDIFRDWGLHYYLLSDADPLRQLALIQKFVTQPAEWGLVDVEGRALLFAWHDPAAKPVAERVGFDLTHEAPIHAVFPPQRHPSAKLRAFIDFLVERLGGEHGWRGGCNRAARPLAPG